MDDALEALVSRIRQAMQTPADPVPGRRSPAVRKRAVPSHWSPPGAPLPRAATAAAEVPSFSGSAADGLVVARVDGRGRVLGLDIDQSLARTPSEDIAAAARDAINVALAARPGALDLSPIVETLRQSQEQARAELSSIVAGINQAVIRVTEARRGGGGSTPT